MCTIATSACPAVAVPDRLGSKRIWEKEATVFSELHWVQVVLVALERGRGIPEVLFPIL
jgi:hypothetical protein